jgi:hypothetical protein
MKPSPLEGEGWVGGGFDLKWIPTNLIKIDRVIELCWHDGPPTPALPHKGGGSRIKPYPLEGEGWVGVSTRTHSTHTQSGSPEHPPDQRRE